jgi:hypothetical protein
MSEPDTETCRWSDCTCCMPTGAEGRAKPLGYDALLAKGKPRRVNTAGARQLTPTVSGVSSSKKCHLAGAAA